MTIQSLNLAGRLARAFVTSKLTIVVIVGLTALGLVATFMTPREENPQTLVPGAVVAVTLPGASPEEVDELIVSPLGSILSEMSGVDHTYGVAESSLGVVRVQFLVGQSKEDSLVKLYDRVMANRGRLPADAGPAQIRAVDADDVPIVTLTLASPRYDDYGLKRMADRMAEHLRSLDGVSVVAVRGGRNREIGVELDPERLQAFGVTLSQVSSAFDTSNLSVPLQDTVRDRRIEGIRLQGFLTSADDVRGLIVGVHGGRPIYVGDIATVIDGPPSEIDRLSRFAFGPGDPRFVTAGAEAMPAVTITVAKKKGVNAVTVASSVFDRVERLKTSFIPMDVHVVATRDDGRKADDAVNLLLEHLVVAVASVSVVLILFLGWREAAIVTISVPLIIFVGLAADLFFGVTINRVTLFALILSLGLLVDAAIVVIENIHRHYGKPRGDNQVEATVAATNEIGNATNLATLAVMLVFGSLLIVTGMPGDYFYPVAFNVPIVVAASVVVAYVVTPWAANRWLTWHAPAGTEDAEPPKRSDLLQRLYRRMITPLQESARLRRILAASIVILLAVSTFQGTWQLVRPSGVGGPPSWFGVGAGFLLKDNKNTFNIIVATPETTAIEETDRVVRDIERLLADEKTVIDYQSWVGQAGIADFNGLSRGTADSVGSFVAEIRVNLVDKHARAVSSIDIVRALRPKIDVVKRRHPGTEVRLVEDPPGPPVRASVLAEIYGPDPRGLRALSDEVSKAFRSTYDMVDLSDTEPADVIEHRIVPDKEKAALSKVSVAQIAQALHLVYGGSVLSRAHPADEKNPVDVRAFVPRRHQIDPTRLDLIFVGNAEGKQVPLRELVDVVRATRDRPIQRKDNERVTYVGGELSGTPALYAVLDLDRRLDGLVGPDGRPLKTGNLTLNRRAPDVIDGYRLFWDGEMRMMLDVYRDMSIALGAALTLVFLILVAYYRSFRVALIAMSAIPLGIIGILPGHWLLGMDFSATSMVGIIALAGVVIRNSLLIIDFIRDHLSKGMTLIEATREAGAVRLRPILLTTLAVVIGSAVMVPDPVFGGLAVSLIFGTAVSTILTVFVVPILYLVAMPSTGVDDVMAPSPDLV
ncbi:efflux RND transporter permease subunit [Pinisolibacter sp.]|uniref:efflux RND transporter permease subunit n=1 Tax=Pinisolibacter sp. TaxID=2172024 RepID=UPI002FDDAE31